MRADAAAAAFEPDNEEDDYDDYIAYDDPPEDIIIDTVLELKRDLMFALGIYPISGDVAELEQSLWITQAELNKGPMILMNTLWIGVTIFQILFDLLQVSVTLGWHEKSIGTSKLAFEGLHDEVYVKIVVIRCATLFILLLSKFSGFFTAADPAYYRRKVTLATGLFLVQLLEFLATWLAQDLHTPGLSFIIMVIICNYSPLRFVTKVLPCFFNLLIYCILVVSSNPDALMQCASLVAFFLVQCLTSYIKESSVASNHLGIQVGVNQELCLVERRKKNQVLLNSMLPPEVSKPKQAGTSVDGHSAPNVESYLDVTVLFCMIDNFSAISRCMTAVEIVQILNLVYSEFDDLVDDSKIYKVETIGEVYMMSAGCPRRTMWHAEYAADMALILVREIPRIREQLKREVLGWDEMSAEDKETGTNKEKADIFDDFNIKVGLNTGAVTAGVIGDTCQRFKLFGDTVNMASRMETNSNAGFVQLSDTTFKILVKSTMRHYNFKQREPMMIKGKGMQTCYFLVGDETGNYSDDFDEDLRHGESQFSLSRVIADLQKNEQKEKGKTESGEGGGRDQLLQMLEMTGSDANAMDIRTTIAGNRSGGSGGAKAIDTTAKKKMETD
ncbi:hypothetical protein TeGR_g13612, partial [Tetraparma gracilis]